MIEIKGQWEQVLTMDDCLRVISYHLGLEYKANSQLKRMKADVLKPHKKMEEMICPQERKY